MAFTYTYGDYAAMGSFDKWFADNILLSKPAWMGVCPVNFDYPRTPLTYPSFSITHFESSESSLGSGDIVEAYNGVQYKGVQKTHVLEVSAWVTRENVNWKRDLRQMGDMIQSLFRQKRSVPINNIYGDLAATGAIIRIGDIRQSQTAPDLSNANVERLRFVVTIHWVERWAA